MLSQRYKYIEIPVDISSKMTELESDLTGDSLEDIYAADNCIEFIYVTKNDEYIGHISFKNLDLSYDIYMLVISPNQQRQGYATLLLNAIKDKMNILEVNANNDNAISFYKKENFTVERILKKYYPSGDGLFMRR